MSDSGAGDGRLFPALDVNHGAAERVRRAARAEDAAVLQALARDPETIVRAALALNQRCGPEIDLILARDEDDRVRALLAARIARLLPSLDSSSHAKAATHVRAVLAHLARDQATRVRAAIADEIKTMGAAPHDLVLTLAQDSAGSVSDPIVRLSPVLTDADLLLLLATPPTPSAAEAIASRHNLSTTVADAIVEHADAPAIRALLANQSAGIKEATLDALVGRAPHHTDWHAPLVCRSGLSTKAISAMSEFIAADLLRVLAARVDLEPGKLDIVRKRLAADAECSDADTVASAKRLRAAGTLTEQKLRDAAQTGDTRRLMALLAVAADVPLATVEHAVELRSAKALVSLTWRAGFSMHIGTIIQTVLAQTSPDDILLPTPDGKFPLCEREMEWQVELLIDLEPSASASGGPTWSGAFESA